MAELPDELQNIHVEETQSRFAVSESIAQKMGSSMNFINNRHHAVKRWDINGNYGAITVPFNSIDGYDFCWKDLTIVEVLMWVQVCGSAGTTELDIKRATASGGSFTSIFSTTPKIAFGAGSGVWVKLLGAGSGLTAPVLTSTDLDEGDALRCDLIQHQTGTAVNGTGIILLHKPR